MAASYGLFLATIYNQSQLAERKHVARYWSIDTAATAVPLSPHPSAITKLAAAIFGGPLFGGGTLPAQYYPCVATTLFGCCSHGDFIQSILLLLLIRIYVRHVVTTLRHI